MLHNLYDDDNTFEQKMEHQQNQQQSIVTNWKRNTEQNMLFTRQWQYGIYLFEYDLSVFFATFVAFQKREKT